MVQLNGQHGQHPVVVRQARQRRPQRPVSRIEPFRREGGEPLAEVCLGNALADDRTTGSHRDTLHRDPVLHEEPAAQKLVPADHIEQGALEGVRGDGTAQSVFPQHRVAGTPTRQRVVDPYRLLLTGHPVGGGVTGGRVRGASGGWKSHESLRSTGRTSATASATVAANSPTGSR